MVEILTVCTGNVCRSPLAAAMLHVQLAQSGFVTRSAGTRGLTDAPMTRQTIELARSFGIPDDILVSHRATALTEDLLQTPTLIFTMTRDHRREVVELAPSRVRATFTIREFARLADSLTDHQLHTAANVGGSDPASRVRAMSAAVASQRGLVVSPAELTADDVIDPYGRSQRTYQLSASQLTPAVNSAVRALKLALV